MPSAFIFFRILKSRRSRFRAGQRLDLNLFSTHLPCFPKKEKEKKTQPKKGIAKEGDIDERRSGKDPFVQNFIFCLIPKKVVFLSSEEDPKTQTTFELPFNLFCHRDRGLLLFPARETVCFISHFYFPHPLLESSHFYVTFFFGRKRKEKCGRMCLAVHPKVLLHL